MMSDETLILTVGGTPRPLEVAIEQIKPRFVLSTLRKPSEPLRKFWRMSILILNILL